jgi:DTW domain-containing protein YfiP
MTWIVPDGSWRQARKVSLREKALARVPRYKLPDGLPSTYRLRHTVHERNLSTFEAIARMLGIVEGYPVQAELEKLFLKMVERTLWSRGNLTPEQCSTEIPAAAILASYIAGAAGSRKPEATLASLNVEPGIV